MRGEDINRRLLQQTIGSVDPDPKRFIEALSRVLEAIRTGTTAPPCILKSTPRQSPRRTSDCPHQYGQL